MHRNSSKNQQKKVTLGCHETNLPQALSALSTHVPRGIECPSTWRVPSEKTKSSNSDRPRATTYELRELTVLFMRSASKCTAVAEPLSNSSRTEDLRIWDDILEKWNGKIFKSMTSMTSMTPNGTSPPSHGYHGARQLRSPEARQWRGPATELPNGAAWRESWDPLCHWFCCHHE